jgi:hypothetical protein
LFATSKRVSQNYGVGQHKIRCALERGVIHIPINIEFPAVPFSLSFCTDLEPKLYVLWNLV